MEQFWEPNLKICRLLQILYYGELPLLPRQPAIPTFLWTPCVTPFEIHFKVKYKKKSINRNILNI